MKVRSCIIILLVTACVLGFPQGIYQHAEIFKRAEHALTWTFLKSLIKSKETAARSDVCFSRLSNAMNHFMSDPSIANFIAYSSKNIYDPGDYISCKKESTSYYLQLSVHLTGDYDISIRAAFCLPRECSVEYLNNFKPEIAATISGLLDITVGAKDVTMVDIVAENKRLNKIQPGLYVFMGITLAIFITCIISTIFDYRGRLNGYSMGTQLALAFSFQKNLKSLFSTENRVDPKLNVFNGVRVLSICWIILNHSWLTIPYEPLMNLSETVSVVPLKKIMSFVKAGPLAVDIFFVLSGFLCAMSLCGSFKDPKRRTIKNALMAIVNRFLRFLPMQFVALMYTLYVLPTVIDSPQNYIITDLFVEPCHDQWLLALIHVNNLIGEFHSMCMNWTWYLNVDMQFFILTIPLIWMYLRSKKYCFLSMVGLSLISFAAQAYLCVKYSLHKSYVKSLDADMLSIYFMKPYCRINTYLVGMVLYFAYEDSKKEEGYLPFKKLQHWIGDFRSIRYLNYALGFGMMAFIVSASYLVDEYVEYYTKFLGAIDVMFSRPIFTIGFAMMIYPVLIGRGRAIFAILAFPMFAPLAKITFGTYMLHLQFYFHYVQSILNPVFYTDSFYLSRVFGKVISGYLLSFAISMLYEVPGLQVQKILLGPPVRRPPPKPKAEIESVEEPKTAPGEASELVKEKPEEKAHE